MKPGRVMYVLHDKDLKGFLTWMEKGVIAVLMFTKSELAEEYRFKVFPTRPIDVYQIHKTRMSVFVSSMLNSNIQYAVIDAPWQHADVLNEYDDEVIRNYAIVDLRVVKSQVS